MAKELKCPWPYFGGKKRAVDIVWSRLGDVSNYIEPFCGSAAMLLGRPTLPKIETLNDVDCYVACAWRALRCDPDAVADWASAPVNEADLHADHRWLMGAFPVPAEVPTEFADPALEAAYRRGWRDSYGPFDAEHFRRRMRTDPDYYDTRVAGLWIQGICCWIGSGWCSDSELREDGTPREKVCHPDARGVVGIPAERPILAGAANGLGRGVHSKGPSDAEGPGEHLPRLTGGRKGDEYYGGPGVHAEVPDDAKGPTQKIPNIDGRGVDSAAIERGPSDAHRPQLADACSRGRGVHADPPGAGLSEGRRPHLGGLEMQYGMGIHAKGPGTGLSRQMPEMRGNSGAFGRGVHSSALTAAGAPGGTVGTCEARRAWLREWFGRLRDRLRTVRVCCGSWDRVCSSESVTTRLGLTGIFLDPPYCHDLDRMHAWVAHLRGDGPEPAPRGKATSRSADIYSTDGGDVDRLVAEVHIYCAGRGTDPMLHIALAGYSGEHEALESLGWTAVAWRAGGGYGNRNKNGNINRDREIIWFSPHCLDPERDDRPLFAGLED